MKALGGRVGEAWAERASLLTEYVRQPDRVPFLDYDAIRKSLVEYCGMPVVETPHVVGPMGPLGDADQDYGRCSVRLLDLLGEARVYVVISQTSGSSRQRMLWSLLHELGHFVNQWQLFVSLGTLYQRLCLNPRLEMSIGSFARDAAASLYERHELEADVFAVDWLFPPWMDEDDELRRRADIPDGLSADGYRFYRLRCAMESEFPLTANEDLVRNLNRARGSEQRQGQRPYPHGGSLWARASWALFNRRDNRGKDADSTRLMREYFKLAGYPARFLPELTGGEAVGVEYDAELAWIERVAGRDIADVVDGTRWSPILVTAPGGEDPPYYVPIRPVPCRDQKDSELSWVHMIGPPLSIPRSLGEWLGRAEAKGAGLLVFPRNPAERILDSAGRVRP